MKIMYNNQDIPGLLTVTFSCTLKTDEKFTHFAQFGSELSFFSKYPLLKGNSCPGTGKQTWNESSFLLVFRPSMTKSGRPYGVTSASLSLSCMTPWWFLWSDGQKPLALMFACCVYRQPLWDWGDSRGAAPGWLHVRAARHGLHPPSVQERLRVMSPSAFEFWVQRLLVLSPTPSSSESKAFESPTPSSSESNAFESWL